MPESRIRPEQRIRPERRFTAVLASSAVWALSAVLALSVVCRADNSSGAAFLRLGGGARPLAMGDAYTAAPTGDVDSIYYNPAGLSLLNHPELSFTHSEWFQDTNYDVISYGHPTALGTFAASGFRVGGSSFEGRDANRLPTGSFTAEDFAGVLSYAKAIGLFGAGASFKYIESRIDSTSASTYALDAGLSMRVPQARLMLGAAALNMGQGLRFIDQVDRLPLTLALGSSWQAVPHGRIALDFKHLPYDQYSELDMGAEYMLSLFAFRIGYGKPLAGTPDNTWSASNHVRGGIGIRVSRFRLDYTLAPFGDLGLTQRITLATFFGPSAEVDDEFQNLQEHEQARAGRVSPDPLLAQIAP